MRRTVFILAVFLVVISDARVAVATSRQERFAIYYSNEAAPSEFEPYRLLVFDQDRHPPLEPLLEHGKIILGYVSLGEIKKQSPYFPRLQKAGAVLAADPNWQGSYTLDLRNPLWGKFVIEEIIPSVLRAGFSGIFMDTLDSPLELENKDPKKYAGMKRSAGELIEAVRMHYPDLPIMLNRAYPLLPRVAPLLDMELGESVYSDYDFERKEYAKVEPSLYRQQVEWLKDAERQNGKLGIYTLDYADPDDEKSIRDIYRTERENGFIPYVATVDLDRLMHEPKS